MKYGELASTSGVYTYHPMHMHIHTCHQPGGSMEGHIYNAASLGMNYIRFTDHDVRTGPKENPVCGYDFSCGTLMRQFSEKSYFGWIQSENCAAVPSLSFSDSGLQVRCDPSGFGGGEWKTLQEMYFTSDGNRHTVSLLAGVKLHLGLAFKPEKHTRLLICVRLSQRPPEHIPASIVYYLGEKPAGEAPHCVFVPLLSDGEITLDLSKDTVPECIGGLDNVFDTVTLSLQSREGQGASYRLSSFRIEAESGFDSVIVRQRTLADAIGARYGVKPFVTTEISAAGQHKNCYATAVPVIDYQAHGYRVSAEEAIAHVRRYGGIFSYNHPFSVWKKLSFTAQERARRVEMLAEELVGNRVFGASLIEIGFPRGHSHFTLAEHLRLWDLLSLAGVFITGYGDSDSHSNTGGWFGNSNNFAAWIASVSQGFPVPEAEFMESMRAGRLYSGDPAVWNGRLCFTAEDGAQMGSVFTCVGEGKPIQLHFSAQLYKNWRVRIVSDETAVERKAEVDGALSWDFTLPSRRTVSFARVEVYDADGRCVVLTNPIYYVRQDEFAGELPPCRLAMRRSAE